MSTKPVPSKNALETKIQNAAHKGPKRPFKGSKGSSSKIKAFKGFKGSLGGLHPGNTN